jgi:two-component system response regulator YesN
MYKVLLADDEPAALEALRLAADWEKLGYVICGECSNGEEAVRLLESLRPDLVVTDVRMPVMDGLDFVRHAAELMRSDAEFILVSGYDEF